MKDKFKGRSEGNKTPHEEGSVELSCFLYDQATQYHLSFFRTILHSCITFFELNFKSQIQISSSRPAASEWWQQNQIETNGQECHQLLLGEESCRSPATSGHAGETQRDEQSWKTIKYPDMVVSRKAQWKIETYWLTGQEKERTDIFKPDLHLWMHSVGLTQAAHLKLRCATMALLWITNPAPSAEVAVPDTLSRSCLLSGH